MVKLHEKGTHCWEENTSVNICKKKIILKSREKKKEKSKHKSRPPEQKPIYSRFSIPRRINNWHVGASEAATKQMDRYGYSPSYIY